MAQSSGRGGVFNASQLVKAMNYSTPHKVWFENFTVEEAQTLGLNMLNHTRLRYINIRASI